MSGNDINRVATTIGDVTKKVQNAADDAVSRLNALANESMNKLGKVHNVCDNWEKANAALDDFLGMGSNNPPEGEQIDVKAEGEAKPNPTDQTTEQP